MTDRRERLEHLLADRAIGGLDATQQAELDALLAEFGAPGDEDGFDFAAAAVEIAFTDRPEPMPAALRARLEGAARAFLEERERGPVSEPDAAEPSGAVAPEAVPSTHTDHAVHTAHAPAIESADGERSAPTADARASAPLLRLGWSLAAAGLLFALWGWWPRLASEPAPSLAERRAALIAAGDAVVAEWQTLGDPAAEGASGDVVWSPREQRGYMRFVGVVPNDPSREQYQLWIFDEERDERYPVDGGVFDVGDEGEVIVAIDASVRVSDAWRFAVTVERPGGVVVSSRERILTLADV